VGDVVAGKYVVQGLLGEGGMGVVLAARQVNLDRLVALKLLPVEAAKDKVMVSRFLREARAAARLQSDHVAKVIDVGTMPSGAPYMVMEHLEGANLGQVLATRGRLEVATACDYLVQACHAVGEAHALGIVHRDLKPENLYLTTTVGGTAMVKVLDFGVSKVLTAAAIGLTTTSTAVGSPMYMAPEQMRASRETDARADVWALGVVLYELLTQRCPFEADTLPDLCIKVVGEAPAPIAALRADLPPEIVAIVERCLEKDPSLRYADARALAAALEPFVPSSLSMATPSAPRLVDPLSETVDEPLPVALPRRPRRSRAGLLAGGLAVCALAGALLLARRSPPPAPRVADAPARVAPVVAPAPSAPLPPAQPVTLEPPAASSSTLAPPRPPSPPAILRPSTRSGASARPDDDIPAFR
jgi:serine/threonine protein kinase